MNTRGDIEARDETVLPNWQSTVFVVRDRPVTVHDVILAGFLRGDLEADWRTFLHGHSCTELAERSGREADFASIQAESVNFRQRHDLITAEEAENWLAVRGLTLSDFSDHFIRRYWAEQTETFPDAPPIPWADAAMEVRDAFRCDLMLSGAFDAQALRLAARHVLADPSALDAGHIADYRDGFLRRHGIDDDVADAWIERIGLTPEEFEQVAGLEAAYRAGCVPLLTEQACRQALLTLYTPLTRITLETMELDSLEAAREALLCIREDGMSMDEVAAEARYPCTRRSERLRDLDDELARAAQSARVGQVFEPVQRGEGYLLCRLVEKREPTLDDPEVAGHVEELLIERRLSEVMHEAIRWSIPVESPA